MSVDVPGPIMRTLQRHLRYAAALEGTHEELPKLILGLNVGCVLLIDERLLPRDIHVGPFELLPQEMTTHGIEISRY